MVKGTVYDINTGKVLKRETNINRPFLYQIKMLQESDQQFYVVFGKCKHLGMRKMVEDIRAMGVKMVFSRRTPEQCLIVSGYAKEWADIERQMDDAQP